MSSHEHVERATHVIAMSCVVAISPTRTRGCRQAFYVDKLSIYIVVGL